MAAPLYKGLVCGDCDRVYPLKRRRLDACPACDSALRLTMKTPTVTDKEAFELWDSARVKQLEGLMDATASPGD